MPTFLTALVILALIALAVGKLRRDKKSSPCGGNCSFCNGGRCIGACTEQKRKSH